MTAIQQKKLFLPDSEAAPWERDDAADRLFAEVVFNRPVDESFFYEVPYPLRDRMAPGKRIVAPFGRGNEKLTGYCVRLSDREERRGLKSLIDVVDDDILLGPTMLQLAHWMAAHYCCAYGQALDAVLPASVKAGAGTRNVSMIRLRPEVQNELPTLRLPPKQKRVLELLGTLTEPISLMELARLAHCTPGPIRALLHRNLVESIQCRTWPKEIEGDREPAESLDLTADQIRVMGQIEACLDRGGFHAMLLRGVTGSGKTEVYMRAIDRVVRAGREAIVLVPEISLTPQTIRRFRSRFPRVAVLHSHLADAERHAQWRRIAAGDAQVIVGARSAVFAPAKQLGLIVIDEEHESTFKQDTTPRYHARDVAWRRAELDHVPLLLGSATPSLESWHRAQTGRCELLELPDRVLNRPLPEVKLIDMRMESAQVMRGGAISLPLQHAIRRALEAGGQVILLLNRRGYSTHIYCTKCGHVAKCRRCEISLVYHRDRSAALCHFCDLAVEPPPECPKCKDKSIRFRGLGTERLEQEVRVKFPGHACHRMDTDSMRGRGSHERVLEAFRRGELRILLGTQMIAKGLDFPGVTLVGVVNADTALHLPDFRAAERTFQLVAQVAGRTGRGEHSGRVLVQTFSPSHAAIQAAAQHDFIAFATAEMQQRRVHGYPPFRNMARVIVRSSREAAAQQYIDALAARITLLATGDTNGSDLIRVLGPAPAPITRIKNLYRFHLQVQGPEGISLSQILRPAITAVPPPRFVEVAIDVDPLSML